MKFIVISILCALSITSFYNLQFTVADQSVHTMSAFRGKRVLLVNIATGSRFADQLSGLQQLQNAFPDSLVVIGFPSNSFGKETRTDSEISQYCLQQYNARFLLASKGAVSGANAQPVYDWLQHQVKNGSADLTINQDFQKILVNGKGEIVGIFSAYIKPTDSLLINAIKEN